MVRTGDTAVVCGVRPEILLASDIPRPYRSVGSTNSNSNSNPLDKATEEAKEMQELGLLVPNLELSTGCSPAHVPGNAPGSLAQSLTQRVLALLHSSRVIDGAGLKIEYLAPVAGDDEVLGDADEEDEGAAPVVKAYWTLYIDVLCISLDGNPFDAAWAAVLAALKDTRLPRAWWDADREMVVCSDKMSEAKRIGLRGLPVASTFAVFSPSVQSRRPAESWVLADPDGFEQDLCQESVTVIMGEDKKILKVEKNGGGVVGVEEMREIVGQAETRRDEWKAVIMGPGS